MRTLFRGQRERVETWRIPRHRGYQETGRPCAAKRHAGLPPRDRVANGIFLNAGANVLGAGVISGRVAQWSYRVGAGQFPTPGNGARRARAAHQPKCD